MNMFVFLFGAFFVGVSIWKIIQESAASKWPTVRAEIMSSRVETGQVDNVKGGDSRSHSYHSVGYFYPKVQYRYQVSGNEYTSEDFSPSGHWVGDKEKAEELVFRFPAGQKVDAYYNPQNPQKSYLVVETPMGNWGILIVGIVIILFSFVF